MDNIDPYILGLRSPENFITMFYRYRLHYDTDEKAYEAVERIYTQCFHERRYKNFESFREVKNNRLRKKK